MEAVDYSTLTAPLALFKITPLILSILPESVDIIRLLETRH